MKKNLAMLAMSVIAVFSLSSCSECACGCGCGSDCDCANGGTCNCGCQKVDKPEDPRNSIDTSYKPELKSLQQNWLGEYEGWDAAQERDTKIKRKLVLNANLTYTNVIEGILAADGKNKYTKFESEAGTYSYNQSTGVITYTVRYDSLLNYQNQQFVGYTKKHYYSPDGMNADDKASYTEKAQFTASAGGYRSWVTEDTYLQQLSAEKLDLWFTMNIEK